MIEDRYSTIMVISHPGSKVSTVRFRRSTLRALAVIFTLFVCLSSYLAIDHARLAVQLGQQGKSEVQTALVQRDLSLANEQVANASVAAQETITDLQQAIERREEALTALRERYAELEPLVAEREEILRIHRGILRSSTPVERAVDIGLNLAVALAAAVIAGWTISKLRMLHAKSEAADEDGSLEGN